MDDGECARMIMEHFLYLRINNGRHPLFTYNDGAPLIIRGIIIEAVDHSGIIMIKGPPTPRYHAPRNNGPRSLFPK